MMSGVGEGGYACGDAAPIFYPSLIDPKSPDRNFMTVGETAELFLTRFNINNCHTGMDRDLIRYHVVLTQHTLDAGNPQVRLPGE
jgi:hypothetical protein